MENENYWGIGLMLIGVALAVFVGKALGAVCGVLGIAIILWAQFRKKPPSLPAHPATVHQENKQEFNPQFNPTITIGAIDPKDGTVQREQARQEEVVLDYLKRQHERRPYSTHFLGSIATAVGMTPAETDQTLKRLFAKDLVFRGGIDAPGDFIWWYRDLV